MSMIFTWLGSFLTGPALNALLAGYKAHLANADNADQRTVDLASRELAVEQREAELNNALLIADEGHWYTAMIRPLFALPFIIYNCKLILWDKVLSSLTHSGTDPLSADLLGLEGKVIMFYFAGRSAEKVAAILKRK